jgi:hypothetical protein
MTPELERLREDYRRTQVPPRYRGLLHFAITTLGCSALIALAVSRIAHPSALELVTLPATFLFANLSEYLAHRGPMHHRRRGLGIVYQRHSRFHHRFFRHDAMSIDGLRDFHIVLFPPVMFLLFFGLVASPIGALLFVFGSSNVAWLFVATAVGYFLSYEWLHTAYHLPADSFVGRTPGLAFLRRLHTVHHDPQHMQRHNFNITYPIGDLIFGTFRR